MNKKIIDTNLIVKYLVNDHQTHYETAKSFFDLVRLGEIQGILEQSVFTETIFVLNNIYKITRDKITEILSELIEYKGIYVYEKEVLIKALSIYRKTNLHILDSIIIAKSILQNLEIESFDKELQNACSKLRSFS